MRFLGIAVLGLVSASAAHATPASGFVYATGNHHGFDAFFGDYRFAVAARDWMARELFCAFDAPCELGGSILLTSDDPFHNLYSGYIDGPGVSFASPYLLAETRWTPDGEWMFPKPAIPQGAGARILLSAPMSVTATIRPLDSSLAPTGDGWNLVGRGFLELDGVLVTAGIHFDYYGTFAGEVERIPEPAVWVLLAAGVGLITLRRAVRAVGLGRKRWR
jgi:hypothetical protein